MSFRSLSIGALVGLAVLFPSLGAASQSADDGAFSVESPGYRVELVAWERYGPEYASVRFRFHLQDKDSGSETVFTVDNATTALESGQIGNDVLLLVGDVQGLATGLTVVDLRDPEKQDFHLSYGGDLSPGCAKAPPGKVVIELAREQYRQGVFRVTELTMDLPADGPQDVAGAADGSHSR